MRPIVLALTFLALATAVHDLAYREFSQFIADNPYALILFYEPSCTYWYAASMPSR